MEYFRAPSYVETAIFNNTFLCTYCWVKKISQSWYYAVSSSTTNATDFEV
jgi:hypothetical protein